MNIIIYYIKRNFGVQKAERFFKERKIPFQLIDLKKSKLSMKELTLFKQSFKSAKVLVDRTNEDALSDIVAHTEDEDRIIEGLFQNPRFMRLPIIRNGRQLTFDDGENEWKEWIK